jgi:putative colanic acid biosynthesis acetyltransferase WcaF
MGNVLTQKDNGFDLSGKRCLLSRKNRIARQLWMLVWIFLFRPSPRPLRKWRAFLLKLFGANLGHNVRIWPSCKVWAPWNLIVGDNTSIGDDVDCYSVAQITIGANTIISQYSYLCAATHDYNDPKFPLIPKAISIGDSVWVAAGAYVGPGVKIGDGAIVGAKSCVYKNVDPWTIVGGNPARLLKERNR